MIVAKVFLKFRLLSFLVAAACFSPTPYTSRSIPLLAVHVTWPCRRSTVASWSTASSSLSASTPTTNNDKNEEDEDNPNDNMMAELSQRISEVAETERLASATFEAGIQRRIQAVAAADESERKALESGTINLPAIVFDSLLPKQALTGRTTDDIFGAMLRDLGLGGLFVMVSLDARARKVRRNGVICRIEYVDVDAAETSSWGGVGPGGEAPTAVDFRVVGRSRCRIVGSSTNMVARIGRWRRGHDPDGEEPVLGFSDERFLDSPFGFSTAVNGESCFKIPSTEWTPVKINTLLENEFDEEITQSMIDNAERILPMLDRWVQLASNMRTYDDTNVVTTVRRKKGEPGLLSDPEKIIRGVLKDLGDRPPVSDPLALCFWGAALVNPLPPLGVSLEARGKMLEATSIDERLDLLERTVTRSIQNLDGTKPL